MSNWLTAGAEWLPLLNAAEDRYALPHNLLARIAFQESSFRPEVIDCQIASKAGALGIMQLMPAYFPNAGHSPAVDIDDAAQLLANLHARYKDWQLALAGYNWGGGNVHHVIVTEGIPMLADLPAETANYVKQIVADVPVPGILV